MKEFNVETWEQTADYVLAPLVAEQMVDENNRHYWLATQAGVMAMHFPNGYRREVFQVVSGLILQDKPVHFTTIQSELNGSTPSEYLTQLYTLYQKGSTLSGHVFEANVATLRDYGERAFTIKRLREADNLLVKGGPGMTHDRIVSDAINALAGSGSETIENETAEKMAIEFMQYMSEKPQLHLLTGIELIDNWTGGFPDGAFVAIVAPMKQRKTSLVLNILVNMARQGKSVALMMLESNKRMVNAMLVSMFAIEWLLKNGLYMEPAYNDEGRKIGYVRQIKPDTLVKLQGNYPLLGKVRAEAIEHGIQELHSISSNLRVYDRTRNGGSLNDNASIHRVCLRDKALFDTDFIAIDHAQRINELGNDYEKLTSVVPYLEALARRENIAMCLLAQLNASTSEGTGNTHMAGVRGGAVLDEAVDYMFITGYKQKMPDSEDRRPANHLVIGLQHSRYGDGGPQKREVVKIDPYSGLILRGGKSYKLGEDIP